MCCTRLAENTGRKNLPSVHHRKTLLGCVFATTACIDCRKNLLNSNISSTCSHNIVNFDSLTAEISWRVWGTPANFNGFRVLASLLQWRHSTEVNQTLHDVWPYQRLVHWCSCSSYLPDSERSITSLIKHPAVKTAFVYYNTTLPLSAPDERLFIFEGQIGTPRRNRLSDVCLNDCCYRRQTLKHTSTLPWQ